MAVTFYKVTVNAELANTEPSFPGTCRGRCLRASGYDILSNQSIDNFVLCVLPSKDALIYTVVLTLNSWPMAQNFD